MLHRESSTQKIAPPSGAFSAPILPCIISVKWRADGKAEPGRSLTFGWPVGKTRKLLEEPAHFFGREAHTLHHARRCARWVGPPSLRWPSIYESRRSRGQYLMALEIRFVEDLSEQISICHYADGTWGRELEIEAQSFFVSAPTMAVEGIFDGGGGMPPNLVEIGDCQALLDAVNIEEVSDESGHCARWTRV